VPQVLVNVADVDKARANDDELVAAAVLTPRPSSAAGPGAARPSGTEALAG